MAEPLLQIEDLSKRFGGVVASDNITLVGARGELHAIIGPNGAGKTTLIGQLTGEIMPNAGRIHFAGEDITAMPTYQRAALGLARSFQITSLFLDMTVLDNVALAVQAHAGHSFQFWQTARKEEHARAGARGARARRPGRARRHCRVADMSHGEHRQLEIAMALATKPRMLLLDEPMAGMGPDESARLVKLLRELKKEYTILLIEHDMEAVFALADRISVLVYGRVIATGMPDEIRVNAEVRRAYLGEQEVVTRHGCSTLLEVDGIETCYGLSQVLFGLSLDDRARRDGDADGPQRHGQDHDHALDHGADAGARRLDPLRRARRSAGCRPIASRKLGIGLVPEGRQIFPNLTVRENLVAAAANASVRSDPWTLEKVCELFPRLARAARPAWAICSPAASSRCSRSGVR